MKTYFYCRALIFILSLTYCSGLFATTYTWKPASGTSGKNKQNWRTACNTVGSTFPTSSDTIIFNFNCSNASCVLDTTFNVRMIDVKSNYTGAITTSTGISLTFDQGRFKGGTFNGGSIAITFNVELEIDGTAFTSTSDILTIFGDLTYRGSSFSHSNGTVIYKRGSSATTIISGISNGSTTLTLYKAEFAASTQNTQYTIRNITMVVENELKMTGTYQLFLNTNSSSTVECRGNVITTNTSTTGGGTLLLLINGTGSQSLSGNQGMEDAGKLPSITINKSGGGTLSLSGIIVMGGSTTWTYTAGTVSEGTAKVIITYNGAINNNSGGVMQFHILGFYGRGDNHTVTGKVKVTDSLITALSGVCLINGDTLEAQGKIVWNNTSSGSGGTVTYKLTGSNAQTISGVTPLPLYDVIISKDSGDITLEKEVKISNNIKFATGYLVSDATSPLTIKHGATVSGASEASFVKGQVKKIGNSAFTFPIGKDSIYQPLGITAPSASSDVFVAEYFNYTQPHGFNKDSLTYLGPCEYWNLQRATGSSNVKVTLHWNSNSCHIYTLSTLRIARWDGTKWNNLGPVTTTGNTTSGTVQTNSNQSYFGNFIIAKRSPAVVANAGTDATISLGNTATLGGSPSATGGVSPYTYKWIAAYALSNATAANPTAKPFSTFSYYLQVIDADKSVDLDTVKITVNGFDLKTATRFPLLTDDSLILTTEASVIGAVGIKQQLSGTVVVTDSILINTSNSNLAVRHLDTAIQKIDALSASSLSGTLNGQTVSEGVYRVSGNAVLNGDLTLQGTSSSYIVIDINGNLSISDNSSIILDGINWNQIYLRAGDVTISGSAELNGIFLLSGKFTGDVTGGSFYILGKGRIRGSFINNIRGIIGMEPASVSRSIVNYFGYNASNVIQEFGLGSGEFEDNINDIQLKALKPDLLRYPAGSDANWWRWQTGWFRGYDNPLFNADNSPSGEAYKDDVPMPEYCLDGLPWDLISKQPQLNHFLNFKETIKAGASYPVFDINMLSSDAGTEIGGLFYAHCNGLPVKYIELGNEYHLAGDEAKSLYNNGSDYIQVADNIAGYIKQYFPGVKISAVAATIKLSDPDRRNTWNNQIESYLNSLSDEPSFDALSFHIYTGLRLDKSIFADCELDSYIYSSNFTKLIENILSTPDDLFDGLETSTEPEKEFKLLDDSPWPIEGWITEFNQEDDKYDFHGRWAHGLFTSLMALRALENPNITKATCYELLATANRDIVFSTNSAFITNKQNCSETDLLPSTQWALGAAGKALRYVGMATKNAYSARQIQFSTVPVIHDESNEKHPGLYGWVFSNTAAGISYSSQDSNWAVVMNLTADEIEIATYNLFPKGGEYFLLYQNTGYGTSPLGFITDASDGNQLTELSHQTLSDDPATTIKVPGYSILLIRGGNQTVMGTLHAEFSNVTTCDGKPLTAYLSCTGAESFYVSNANNINVEYDHPTVVATVTPNGNDIHIQATGPSGNSFVIVPISVSEIPTIGPTVSGTPACSNNTVELDANGGVLSYNWYPTPDYETLYDEETFEINVSHDITYTVNATDGICYCASSELPVNVYDTANAGPDIYICDDPEVDVILGGANSYPGATLVVWSKDTDSPPFVGSGLSAHTQINTSSLDPGVYHYQLLVVYPGLCQSNDDVYVHVLDCCDGTGGSPTVFDPYQSSYASNITGSPYFTGYDLANMLGTYTTAGGTSILDDIGSLIGYNGQIIINGPFIINLNLTLEDCPNITFGKEAEIFIETNCNLTILDNTNLFAACGEMWNGITIEGNLVQSNGLIIEPGDNEISPIIQDAVMAVKASKDSRMGIEGTTFKWNHEHLHMENYGAGFNGTIIGNTFTSDNYLASMLPPYDDERTSSAIYINDLPAILIGDISLTEENDIIEADVGIESYSSGLNAYNNNIVQTDVGIKVVSSQDDVNIFNNEVDDFRIGIFLFNNFNITQVVQENIIGENTTPSGLKSIGILSESMTTELHEKHGHTYILFNEIYGFDWAGIALNSMKRTNVRYNDIGIEPVAPSNIVCGILLENCDIDTIANNIILGFGTDYTNRIGIKSSIATNSQITCNTIDKVQYGLQAMGANNDLTIAANKFKKQDRAIALGEAGTTSASLNDQYYSLDDGLTCGNEFIGDGSLTNQFGNGNGDALYAIDYNGPFVKYFAIDDGVNGDLFPYLGVTGAALFVTQNIGSINSTTGFELHYDDPSLPDYATCSIINQTGLAPYNTSLDPLIIDNSLEFSTEQTDCYRWTMKYQLYNKLHQNPFLRTEEPYTTFYDTTANNSIGKFWIVDSLISLLGDTSYSSFQKAEIVETALDENSRISTSDIFENNLQIFNDIYLNAIAATTEFIFTLEQEEDLFGIADQCPYTGGFAVFKARAIYSLINDTFRFDDHLLCYVTPRLDSANTVEPIILYRLYPNPADKNVTLEYNLYGKDNVLVTICDLSGREVRNFNLKSDASQISLDISTWSSGMYNLKMYSNAELLGIEKIVVIR